MRTLLAVSLLAAGALCAADSDFNGRWDIRANTPPRPRAWWVELNGVGTPQANGTFVSAYGGDRNTISTIAVENGELRFTINPPMRNGRSGKNGKNGKMPAFGSQLTDAQIKDVLKYIHTLQK